MLFLPYLLVLPFEAWGLAVLVGLSTLVSMLLGRAGDVMTCAITTAVVLVPAAISPQSAWQLPILRLIDTTVGIAVGLVAVWIAHRLGQAHRSAGDAEGASPMRASSR